MSSPSPIAQPRTAMTDQETAAAARTYALGIIREDPRASLREAVLATMCAYESLHHKCNAARVGCAMAVEDWVNFDEPTPTTGAQEESDG